MDELPLDPELASVERHIVSLSRRVEPDPSEYTRLRQELLRRHQERRTETTQRAVRSLWPRLTGVKRLTLVAPPALAAAVALFAVLAAIQISGHQSTESAQAAQITRALSHTVPTITAWQVNVQHERGDSTMSLPCPATRLGKDQRLVMRDGRTYWYSGGQWYRVTEKLKGGDAQCPADLTWAMAILPAHLQQPGVKILAERTVRGRSTEGVRFTASSGRTSTTTTLWVDRQTGLVLRADRLIFRDGKRVGRDLADYSYTR